MASMRNDRRNIRPADGGPRKRKWVPDNKVFEGSVKEGQGFAFKRKEKVRHEYNKLKRKESRRQTIETKPMKYQDEYPEHLKHLYVAEAQKLKTEEWTNRVNRSTQRMKTQQQYVSEEEDADCGAAEPETKETSQKNISPAAGVTEKKESATKRKVLEGSKKEAEAQKLETEESTNRVDQSKHGMKTDQQEVSEEKEAGCEAAVPETEVLSAAGPKETWPISNRMKKKLLKKTSLQKTKEEFEKAKEEQQRKKEKFFLDKKQREEAIQKYKQKKMESYQLLCKKTKKGQPNLNLQMEYLLQKIQKS